MQKHDRPSGAEPNRPSHPRARARTRSCGACSSRRRGPTARCTARRGGCGSTRAISALATQLTLRDRPARGHARPRDRDARAPAAGQARPAGAGRAAARGLPTDVPGPRARARRRRRVGRAGQGATRRAAPGSSTPSCAAPTREARPIVAAPARPHARRRPRSPTRTPSGSRELWFDALGAPDARALMAADNEPAEAVLRANTLKIAPDALADRLPVPRAHRRRRADPRRAVRRVRLARVAGRAC